MNLDTAQRLLECETRADLAEWLGEDPRRLAFYAYVLPEHRRYSHFTIEKRAGGSRHIHAPIAPIKEHLRLISAALSHFYNPRNVVMGFVKERNIVDNANKHSRQEWILRVDLKDFFPTIHFGRVVGVLQAAPFQLRSEVAQTIAQLACHQGVLAQGAPTSPIFSNLVCRGLDHELLNLARRGRCRFTRYADDLNFSTSRKRFPDLLAARQLGSEGHTCEVSAALLQVISKHGFTLNDSKTRLVHRSQRQTVTGLVCNETATVSRRYYRGLRAVLHVWRKYGEDSAAEWFLANHYKRNKPSGSDFSFKKVVIGRVQFIGYVCGWSAPKYQKLANLLSQLDPTFRKKTAKTPPPEKPSGLVIWGEGETDYLHFFMAWNSLHQDYPNLTIEFPHPAKRTKGAPMLEKMLAVLEKTPPLEATVCVFDTDEPKITSRFEPVEGSAYLKLGTNLFVVLLPTPSFRSGRDPLCVELLYEDPASLRDERGRRLYLKDEFQAEEPYHKKEPGVMRLKPRSNSLVVEDVHNGTTQQNVALSKMGFANLVQSKSTSFEGFRALFDVLNGIVETELTLSNGS
ncbi:MAG: reverse transcriptase family protein [Thermoanaerobaculia bacterium]|nr:reverse transcriptase family protein [Thermoanaerobaculia bacterium]